MELLKTYGLNHTLLVQPLTEIKEDICGVLETLDEPLCSSRILDDTEDLLACLNSQDLLEGSEDGQIDASSCNKSARAFDSEVNEEEVQSVSSYLVTLENSPYSVDEDTLSPTEPSLSHTEKTLDQTEPSSVLKSQTSSVLQSLSCPQSSLTGSSCNDVGASTIEEDNSDSISLGDFDEEGITITPPLRMSSLIQNVSIPFIQIVDVDEDICVENVFLVGIEKEINDLMDSQNGSLEDVHVKLKKILVSLC